MSWEFVTQYLDFTNLTNMMNVFIVGLLAVLTFKQRVQLIVSKFKESQATTELEKKDLALSIIIEEMNFIGTTLNQIVQASKMSPDDKLKITQNWYSLQTKTLNLGEKTIDGLIEVADDVKSIVAVGSELTGQLKDILGNVVQPK